MLVLESTLTTAGLVYSCSYNWVNIFYFRNPLLIPINTSDRMINIMKEPLVAMCSTLDELKHESKTTYKGCWTSYQYSMALEKVFITQYGLFLLFSALNFDNHICSFVQFFYGQVGHFNSHTDHVYAVNLGPGHRYLSRCLTDWKGQYLVNNSTAKYSK